jgi:release factor glutamine methyltransferase
LFYHRLAIWAPLVLKKGGQLFLEIGDGMAAAVQSVFRSAGFQDITLTRDLAGKERLVHTIYRGENHE